MAAVPVNAQGSGVVRGDGSFSFPVIGLTPGLTANWTALVSGQRGLVSIFQGTSGVGGSALTSPLPITNGGAAIGPLTTQGAAGVWVQGTNGQVGDTIVVTLIGLQGGPTDDLGSSLPSSVIGATQADPSQLLTGEVGAPLVENQSVGVPGAGFHELFMGQFQIAGYAALLVYGDPPAAVPSQSLFLWLQWDDAQGNRIAFSQIDNLVPKFACIFGCLGQQVEVWLGNTDSTVHNVNNFSVIPLTSIPSEPSSLIPVQFGSIPGSFAPIIPSAKSIFNINTQAMAVGASNFSGAINWNGNATVNWFISGGTTYLITLTSLDASGNVQTVAKWSSGVLAPLVFDLQLPPGLLNLNVSNQGAAPFNMSFTVLAK